MKAKTTANSKGTKPQNSDALKRMREKSSTKSADSAKTAANNKKQSAGVTSHLSANADFQSVSTLLHLQEEAKRIDSEISVAVKGIGRAIDEMKSKHRLIEDFVDRELWRYLPVPGGEGCYKHETAWKKDKANLLGGASTLFNIVSGFKALKGETTQEQREQMGQRKRRLVTGARKQSDKPLPPEIIDAAADPRVSEKQLREQLADAGYVPEKELREDSRQSSLAMPPAELTGVHEAGPEPKEDKSDKLNHTKKGRESVRDGGSGVVQGAAGSAPQFSSKLMQAVMQYAKLYDESKEPLTQMELLEKVCEMFGDTLVDTERILNDGIREAIFSAERALPTGEVMTNRKAFELLMHAPLKKAAGAA